MRFIVQCTSHFTMLNNAHPTYHIISYPDIYIAHLIDKSTQKRSQLEDSVERDKTLKVNMLTETDKEAQNKVVRIAEGSPFHKEGPAQAKALGNRSPYRRDVEIQLRQWTRGYSRQR